MTKPNNIILLRIAWGSKSCYCYIENNGIDEINFDSNIIYDKNHGGFLSFLSPMHKGVLYGYISDIIERNQQTNLQNELLVDFNTIDTIHIVS